MTVDYRIMTVEEMCNNLYHEMIIYHCPILFSFDTRQKASVCDRLSREWYCVVLTKCEMAKVLTIVSDMGKNLESYVIQNRIEMDDKVEDYCRRHNPKYKGKICVDMGYWADTEGQI